MIMACYSNPNWDGKDNAEKRKEYLKDLNEHFNQAITLVYYPSGPKEAEVDWDNPFFAAHRREIARTREAFRLQLGEGDEDKTAGDVLEEEQGSNGHSEFDQDISSMATEGR